MRVADRVKVETYRVGDADIQRLVRRVSDTDTVSIFSGKKKLASSCGFSLTLVGDIIQISKNGACMSFTIDNSRLVQVVRFPHKSVLISIPLVNGYKVQFSLSGNPKVSVI